MGVFSFYMGLSIVVKLFEIDLFSHAVFNSFWYKGLGYIYVMKVNQNMLLTFDRCILSTSENYLTTHYVDSITHLLRGSSSSVFWDLAW